MRIAHPLLYSIPKSLPGLAVPVVIATTTAAATAATAAAATATAATAAAITTTATAAAAAAAAAAATVTTTAATTTTATATAEPTAATATRLTFGLGSRLVYNKRLPVEFRLIQVLDRFECFRFAWNLDKCETARLVRETILNNFDRFYLSVCLKGLSQFIFGGLCGQVADVDVHRDRSSLVGVAAHKKTYSLKEVCSASFRL